MDDRRRQTLALLAASIGLSAGDAPAQSLRELELSYLRAAVAEPLLEFANIEIPALEHIRIGRDAEGSHLELRTYHGQRKKNNGVRAEVSIDLPHAEGDTLRYRWRFRIPRDFESDAPRNLWWLFGSWHDQPNRDQGETWPGFPSRSPPLALGYGVIGGQDLLTLVYGAPGPTTRGTLTFTRGEWHQVELTVKWSRGADGRASLTIDGGAAIEARGPNMHNAFRHYMKLGSYRHPEIRGDAWVSLRQIEIRRL
jgi:Polysaccharide lyase